MARPVSPHLYTRIYIKDGNRMTSKTRLGAPEVALSTS
jgi:hypothetical protein